jgi:hypothetical protein
MSNITVETWVDTATSEKELQETPDYLRELIRKMVAEWMTREPDLSDTGARVLAESGIKAICKYSDFLLVLGDGHIRDPQYLVRFALLPHPQREVLCKKYAARLFMARSVLGFSWVSHAQLEATVSYIEGK